MTAADSKHSSVTVEKTAAIVAVNRLYASLEPEPIVWDPYVMLLLGRDGLEEMRSFYDEGKGSLLSLDHMNSFMAFRTRFGDDLALESTHEQVVILAAGLDTRAWRLQWPPGNKVSMFEVDRSDIFAAKLARLSSASSSPSTAASTSTSSATSSTSTSTATSNSSPSTGLQKHVGIVADLTVPGWETRLVSGGFDPRKRTAWLVEGLLMYLSPEEGLRLCQSIADLSAAGSRLYMDHVGVVHKDCQFLYMFRSHTTEATMERDFAPLYNNGWKMTSMLSKEKGWEKFGKKLVPCNDPNGVPICPGFIMEWSL